jgi:hypothetical protein
MILLCQFGKVIKFCVVEIRKSTIELSDKTCRARHSLNVSFYVNFVIQNIYIGLIIMKRNKPDLVRHSHVVYFAFL